MTHTQYSIFQSKLACWYYGSGCERFLKLIPADQLDIFDVPSALELPLMAKELAQIGGYGVIACAALLVDDGIYRHDFVAQSVVDGLNILETHKALLGEAAQ